MAITERQLDASGQWERTATGNDIPKLMGSLQKVGQEAYKKAFHENEHVKYAKVLDPSGGETHVKASEVDQYIGQGYRYADSKPTMVMPSVPWERKTHGPGKHKFRYDKASGRMMEV